MKAQIQIEIKTLTVDGKKLQQKVIKQLEITHPQRVFETSNDYIFYGYYVIKGKRYYVCNENGNLKLFSGFKKLYEDRNLKVNFGKYEILFDNYICVRFNSHSDGIEFIKWFNRQINLRDKTEQLFY